jgi:hypothetical protein
MLILGEVLRAWGAPQFEQVLKRQLAVHVAELPLRQGMAQGNLVIDTPISILLLAAKESPVALDIRVGIFYQSVIGGCSCADDPTPVSENTEYCVLQLEVSRPDAVTQVRLVDEETA